MALGTVQLGLPYGAANTTGMPSEEQAIEIVHFAVASGVRSLDTAHGYALSQERVGKAMQTLPACDGAVHVITKIDTSIAECATAEEVVALVNASVENSCGPSFTHKTM